MCYDLSKSAIVDVTL